MRSVMLARGDLRPDVKAALKEVLFAMHEDPEGRKVLKAYNKVKKYDPIGSDATANFDEVRRRSTPRWPSSTRNSTSGSTQS